MSCGRSGLTGRRARPTSSRHHEVTPLDFIHYPWVAQPRHGGRSLWRFVWAVYSCCSVRSAVRAGALVVTTSSPGSRSSRRTVTRAIHSTTAGPVDRCPSPLASNSLSGARLHLFTRATGGRSIARSKSAFWLLRSGGGVLGGRLRARPARRSHGLAAIVLPDTSFRMGGMGSARHRQPMPPRIPDRSPRQVCPRPAEHPASNPSSWHPRRANRSRFFDKARTRFDMRGTRLSHGTHCSRLPKRQQPPGIAVCGRHHPPRA